MKIKNGPSKIIYLMKTELHIIKIIIKLEINWPKLFFATYHG